MQMKAVAHSLISVKADNVTLAVVEVPLPVTGGTELDDWPGGTSFKIIRSPCI